MKKIADIVKDIRHELSGAEHCAKMAMRYKEEDRSLADVYADTAAQKMATSNQYHSQVARVIREYRAEHGEPPEAMMAVYNWEHESMIEDMANVKALLEMYKK